MAKKRDLVVDGTDKKSGRFLGDGTLPPFVVFDAGRQENIAGPFDTHAEAEAELAAINNGRKPRLDSLKLSKWLKLIDTYGAAVAAKKVVKAAGQFVKKVRVPEPQERKVKRPTPKVIAAEAVRRAVNDIESISEDGFAQICCQRVTPAKRGKILEQVNKITKKLKERCDAIIDRHYS